MKVATKTITVVRTEMSEGEWATIRQLVAEGLTVVEAVTPAMQAVATALRMIVAEPTPTPTPATKTRVKATKRPALPEGGDP
jgi:hypothetical protein